MGKISKVVVCGAKKSGKTSILQKAIYGANGPFSPTIEDIYVANVDTDRGTREKLRLIDTEGLDDDRVKEIPTHWHSIADGFIIVYSINDNLSFQLADVLRKDIEKNRDKKDCVIVILANKNDKESERKVDKVQAMNWAATHKVKLFEVSAMDRNSLKEAFIYLSSRLNPPPNKSTFPQLSIGRKQPKPSES